MNLIRLAIDFENPAKTWWEGGGRDLWESIADSVDNSSVVVDRSLAESWIAQAAQISGWEGDGTVYSPHPITLKPLDIDEEV